MPGYFQLPLIASEFLPYLGAAALAAIAWLTGGGLVRWFEKSSASRLEEYASGSGADKDKKIPVEMGSFDHKVRLAYIKYNITAYGNENLYLWFARIGLGVAIFLLMLIVGLPFLTSLVGLLAGYVLVNGMVTHAWNSARTDLEGEIPAMLSGLKSAVAGDTDITKALNETASTLRTGSPLRVWAVSAASRMHTEGTPVMEILREEAAPVSTSLSICVELIGGMWTTGGEGYAEAFENAAANLRDVLQARVLARARGAGAQGTVNILMGLAFAMIAFLSRSPSMSATIHTPLVQIAYAAIFLALIYGHGMIGNMIDNAV